MFHAREKMSINATRQVSTWLTNAQAVFPDIITGIVAHWKMNDNSANTDVVDNIGANTGTAQQFTNILTTAKVDRALMFDGTSDRVITNGNIPITGASPRTVTIW